MKDQEMERWRERDRFFYLDLDLDLTQKIQKQLRAKMGLTIRSMLWANILLTRCYITECRRYSMPKICPPASCRAAS